MSQKSPTGYSRQTLEPYRATTRPSVRQVRHVVSLLEGSARAADLNAQQNPDSTTRHADELIAAIYRQAAQLVREELLRD